MIHVGNLVPHKDNPRFAMRDDVVETIAQRIKNGFPVEHAILVRPFTAGTFQIISGHHRYHAAVKAELLQIPAWVREMDDETAFMQLVLANAQGELSPLEIGVHALRAVPPEQGGRGKKGGLTAYAKAIGKSQQYISQLRDAAEVAVETHKSTCGLSAQVLCIIHSVDRRMWPALVGTAVRDSWSVKDAEHWVGKVREFEIPEQWQDVFPLALVVERFLEKKEFSPATVKRIVTAIEAGVAEIGDYEVAAGRGAVEHAQEDFRSWLVGNVGGDSWDHRKVDQRSSELVANLGSIEREEFWYLGNWRDHIHAIDDEGAQLLPDGMVALLLTDPPYGMDYQSDRRVDRRKERRHKEIENDGALDAVGELADMLAAFLPKLADDAHVLCFCHWSNEPDIRKVIAEAGLKIRGSLVWEKNNAGMGDPSTTFAPIHERIIHAVKGSPTLFSRERDVLHAAKTDNELHPTQKPIDLLTQLIEATTAAGQLVADPFGGSASTLVAALGAKRKAWGCEISPEYHAAGKVRLP
jgi:site-specific DNA-methyltransferase (adenine-specific)